MYEVGLLDRQNRQGISKWFVIAFSFTFFIITFRLIFNFDMDFGYVVFISLLLPVMMWLKAGDLKYMLPAYLIFMTYKLYQYLSFETINGPDSTAYSGLLNSFVSYGEFLNYFYDDVTTNFLKASGYNTFGILYYSFFELMGSSNFKMIDVYNTILIIAIAWISVTDLKKHFRFDVDNKNKLTNIFLFMCFTSGSLAYWSTYFLKDITILFFAILGVSLLLNKRYFWFVVIMLFAFTIRSYTIIPVLAYYLLYRGMLKTAIVGLIGALIVVFYASGIVGVLNSFYMISYAMISPNPFSLSNWDNEFIRTFESFLTILSLILSMLVFLLNKESRKFYYTLLLCILIYSCVLNFISFISATYYSIDFVVGTSGDDLSRKRLMIVPMIYIMTAYTISKISIRKRILR